MASAKRVGDEPAYILHQYDWSESSLILEVFTRHRGRVALLDPVKINTKVTVFVSIRTNAHSIEWLKRFSEVIAEFPEVVEFYRMSGDVDYLLRVVVPDIAAYDSFYKKLISKINLTDVSSSFAMGQIKYTTALPLEFVSVADDDK